MIWAGVDEAGRGALAGPVVAAAVILPEGFSHPWLRDSKLLTPKQREKVFAALQQAGALIGIGMQGPEAIERHNILQATLLAMQEAVEMLLVRPHAVRIDGRFLPPLSIPAYAYVHGDRLYPEIAAASIAAKVIRDRLMSLLHRDFPAYDWASNKGYPTFAHKEALRKVGPSPLHRRSFLKGIL